MENQTIRVVTRKSPLAMRQTELAIEALGRYLPEWSFQIIPMSTVGDERMAASLETAGGKGLFTSALEEAIVTSQADLAVHSAKDLPTEMPEGVVLAGFLPRAPAMDVLILRSGITYPSLIATGSPRRRAQLKPLFPKAAWKDIRGNIETRLKKIESGYADATVMAMAGLKRLGLFQWPGLRFVPLPLRLSVPAPGQGAIGLQVRAEDKALFAPFLCPDTAAGVSLERAFLAAMGGGCHTATAAHFRNGKLRVFDEEKGYRSIEISANLLHLPWPEQITWFREMTL